MVYEIIPDCFSLTLEKLAYLFINKQILQNSLALYNTSEAKLEKLTPQRVVESAVLRNITLTGGGQSLIET